MPRASRRGMVDLIVMIVMIVFLLGMGTLAFLTYDKAEKEKQYLAALREIPARQQAELDAVRARYSEVSTLIGFKGDAAFASPTALENLLREGSEVIPDFSTIGSGDTPIVGTKTSTVEVRVFDKSTGEWTTKEISVQEVDTSGRNDKRIYEFAGGTTLQAALGKQDDVINDLFEKQIPRVQQQINLQRTRRAEEAGIRNQKAEDKYGEVDTKIETTNADIQTQQDAVAQSEVALADALEQVYNTYKELDNDKMRDAREEAFGEARAAAAARAEERKAMEAYRLQADERRLDDSRDPDGFVFLVDRRSGWVWINIGQRSDVKLEQTFQVLRADATRSTEVSIGEIRVKEILSGNIARARVDALDDTEVYPEAGDIIKNANFSARQYKDWALVGDFGGNWTSLTRDQLVDLLRSVGYRVQSKIDATTDAVIIGGNWVDDPDWQAADRLNLNIEKYQEEEVLYWLGLSGPDRKD